MSETAHDKAESGRHPVMTAFDDFCLAHPNCFEGSTHGVYLRNRLQEAFYDGWLACERVVKAAMDGRQRR